MRSNHRHLDTDQPLKGLKLVVCGYELERREHRGIAVFSKGLLRSLKQAGRGVVAERSCPADARHALASMVAASGTSHRIYSPPARSAQQR